MRLPIAAFFLVATLAIAQTQNRSKSSYEKDEPANLVKQYPPELIKELIALREAALADDYAYGQVAHLTENIGARPSGSPQAEAAVDYVAQELRKLGLEVRKEDARVPHWIRGIETAELVEFPGQAAGTNQKVVLTALGASTPTSTDGLTADVVVVNNFDELKNLGRKKVAGKIVLFNTRFDVEKAAAGFAGEAYSEAVLYRAKGSKAAAQLGAVASLVRSVGGADYRLPHTGWGEPSGIAAAAVTSEDADLIAHLAAQGNVRMHVVLTSGNGPEVLSHNVVADLKGSEHPEQVVIVSGHLDSWDLGTGAIDDAAGVAVAMETAELIQRLHLHPKRTIRVIAWMDEENGGHGHDAYAATYKSEFANHVAAIESDFGAAHPLGFDAKINANALPWLKSAQEILRPFGANLIRVTNDSPGSDVAPLAKAGIPTFGIMQDGRTYFNYHHTAADTLDKIVPRELRENAAAMAVMGYTLANLPETLPR
jgi:carboxypeptidase Q